ncbi:MAG: hypothetical protein ACKO96_21070, partial [Flammeovirgaceae bacterium]
MKLKDFGIVVINGLKIRKVIDQWEWRLLLKPIMPIARSLSPNPQRPAPNPQPLIPNPQVPIPNAQCLLLVALMLLSIKSFSQNLENIGKEKPLKINGGVSLTQILYSANGLGNRRDPYSYFATG